MKRTLFIIIIFLMALSACREQSKKLNIDISGIADPGISIQRYGQDLFSIDPRNIGEELPELALKYPFFLGTPPLDTLSYIQIYEFITDPFLREIALACDTQFMNLNAIEDEYNTAFRHYKYYFPDAKLAEVYSYISGLDFEYPVQTHGGITLIALDMYLGPQFKPYAMAGIPQYRTTRAKPEYIVRDIMLETGRGIDRDYKTENILLDQMIEEGRLLYFLDATMPDIHDSIKIAFSEQQLDWCIENEPNLWAFVIENEMLFSSDYEKTHKLIIDGPFTSFFPDGSPARTGWWVGWQIVKSFMENNEHVSLPQLMEELSAREILDNSRYNP
jgi:hypothetical protein